MPFLKAKDNKLVKGCTPAITPAITSSYFVEGVERKKERNMVGSIILGLIPFVRC